jgi:type III secretory pathway component EscV
MQQIFRCFAMLMLSLAFLVPTITAQEKKADDTKSGDDKKDTKTETKETKAKAKPKQDWGPEIIAKVTAVDTKDEKDFTVQVQLKVPEPNPGGQQGYLQAQQGVANAQMNLAKSKNPQEYQQRYQALVQAQVGLQKAYANLTKLKDVNIDFKCQAMESMRVRHVNPQTEVDDKTGEFKKLTKKELDALRADGYDGYPTDFKTLAVGQMVRVYFSKDTKPLNTGYDKSGKKMAVDDAADQANQTRYDVIQILILAEPPAKKN